MNQAVEFCRNILPKVSRSFALTIPMLDQELYLPVLITYLQDRLLDNFEDEIAEDKISLSERKRMMDQVTELFNPGNIATDEISQQISQYASLIPDYALEKLTANAARLRGAYDQLSDAEKTASYKWLQEMNLGMQYYLTTPVKTFQELDEYCYYVAGTVGGFLTDIILIQRRVTAEQAAKLKNNFKEAGLFLQKINLVRDIKKDLLDRGKNYWPLQELNLSPDDILNPLFQDKALIALERMVNNIKEHIPALMEYLEALPLELSGFRKFFCINNALGLATIEKIENNSNVFYGKRPVKVARVEFLKILNSPERVFYKKAAYLQNP